MTAHLFSSFYDRKNTTIPGAGIIHSQTVGNSTNTSGIDHYFLAEGEAVPVMGFVRFRAAVDANGAVMWVFSKSEGTLLSKMLYADRPASENAQPDFPADAVAAMRQRSETLDEHAPTEWIFSVLGAVDMEMTKLKRQRESDQLSADHLKKVLADPSNPKDTFIDKDTGFRPATPQERAERRDDWVIRRDKYVALVAAFDVANTDRLALLGAMKDATHRWCEHIDGCPPPKAYLAQKVAAFKSEDPQPLKSVGTKSRLVF